jgi:hypothetical protein
MHIHQHVKLLGRYKTPRFRYGDVVLCELRGSVKIVGLTNARIPWPKCRAGRAHAIILYGDLAEAVRRESVEAVKHWFGVGDDRVWKWRKALGVERENEGTRALLSRITPLTVQSSKARRRLKPALRSPERAAKIAAARLGKPMPAQTRKALRLAHAGRKPSAVTRLKLSAAHKGRRPPAAKGPPWTGAEDALLGTMRDKDVAAKIGRSAAAVADRRYVLCIPAFTKRAARGKPVKWTVARLKMLGAMTDAELAARLGCTIEVVRNQRRRLGIVASKFTRT